MTYLLRAFAVSVALIASVACADNQNGAAYEEGVDFKRITPAQPTDDPDRIEVVEVFSYACSHCHDMEDFIEPWASALPDDVRFLRMPALFRPNWVPLAHAYYSAEILGVTEQTHGPLFSAIHDEKRHLFSQQSLAGFYSDYGVDRETFNKAFKSPGVRIKINRSKDLIQRFGVHGTPSLVIEGKYLVTVGAAKSFQNMLKITDYLIEIERQSRVQN